MPVYDFVCRPCGEVLPDKLLRRKDKRPRCPHCGEEMATKPGAPAFKLEGLGWARDGYSS